MSPWKMKHLLMAAMLGVFLVSLGIMGSADAADTAGNSSKKSNITGGSMMKKQTAGRDALGKTAPKFAELNDDVLFGEVWSRDAALSLRDRSVVTVVTLVAKGMFDSSFTYHMAAAKANGVSREEMAEILTHEAFYAGWPNAWAAFRTMKEVYGENESGKAENSMTKEEFDKINVFGTGEQNVAYAKYFIGNSYLNPLTKPEDPLPVFNVTFEPGCRNDWHIHHAKTGGGQVLICTAGEGCYQEEGQPVVSLKPGMVVMIRAGVKHWHGATATSYFSHIAFELPGEETSTEWLEPVHNNLYKD